MSAALFDDPLTIWATAITSIVVTAIMFFAIPIGIMLSYEEKSGKEYLRVEKLFCIFVATCFSACLAAYLISLGFSQRLFDDISDWRRSRDFFEQDLIWFCVMIVIPVFVHFVSTFRNFRGVDFE